MSRFERTPAGWLALAAALLLPLAASGQEPPAVEADSQEQVLQEDADEEAAEPEPEDPSATGDGWIDAQLAGIGRYAQRYPDAFADELVRYHDVPRTAVASLLEQGWEPGDVYFACALGGVTGRSCRFVVGQRGQPPQASWRALAQELGAGVGTPAFARLKRGIVESHIRWARPLELDDELRRAFPDYGKPAAAADGGD
ncbi:hypothetical protein ACOPJQ_02180 [Luteimonas dalianensis]|uniref:hypothetical protein n=1 Tax=Luteimonas dalianensis TaxID=1148196 RepID=UPI003BEFE947